MNHPHLLRGIKRPVCFSKRWRDSQPLLQRLPSLLIDIRNGDNHQSTSVSPQGGDQCGAASWSASILQTVNTEGGRLDKGKLGLLSQTLIPAGGPL